MKKLPVGIQSFEKLRSNDYLYVDKTKDIYQIISKGDVYFLSRPRRFGKSLLISTLDALFRGQKELFERLYIYDKWDWTQQYPIIRIDWTQIKHATAEEMENSVKSYLRELAEIHQITFFSEYASDYFGELIRKLHRNTGQKVAVLIDEYDIPILDAMDKPVIDDIRGFLQDFYKRLKANDEHLKFVFLTGVSKFAKISIFSTLNSLRDITISEEYAAVCGYTQEELEYYFSEHINCLVDKESISKAEVLEKIRIWYDGYSWDGKTSVYNPFSTLLLFTENEFSNYWFASGTPTFLMEQLKRNNQIELVTEPVIADPILFDSFDPNNIENIPLLFQTGYLTIKNKEKTGETPQYTLAVPNTEVRESLMRYLLSAYSAYPLSQISMITKTMEKQMNIHDAEGFAQSVRVMLQNIPFNLQIGNEKYYHSLFLSWMYTLGFKVNGEIMTGIGRIDAVLEQPDIIVVTELKYDAKTKTTTLLKKAMNQIRDRRYYEKYLDKGKKILLMSLAFSGKDVDCKMEEL
jgi:hypothetical protein